MKKLIPLILSFLVSQNLLGQVSAIPDWGTGGSITYSNGTAASIVQTIDLSAGDPVITYTSNQITLGNFAFDIDQAVGVGQDNYVLTYDHASQQILLEVSSGSGSVEDDVFGAGWNGDTTNAPSQNAVYDYLVQIDPDSNGTVDNDELGGLGTGVATALGINTGSAGAPVVFDGALGTPTSGNAANLTNLPLTGIAGLEANTRTYLDTPTLANWDTVLGITGTADGTTFLRGDGAWATPSGSGAFTADGDTQITPSTAIVLDQATGNEIGLDLAYTTNKATSGNDTGLRISMTDTASPGTSYPLEILVGGSPVFTVDESGNVVLAGTMDVATLGADTFNVYDSTDQSHYMGFVVPDLSGNITATIPSTSNFTFVDLATSQTLTNKTLTSPTLDGSPSAAAANDFTLPNGVSPTTSADGHIAFDNNAWAASRGSVAFYDGTATVWTVATLATDTPTNGQIPKWNTGGTITWEDDATGGTPTLDTVGDPVAATTLVSGATGETITFDFQSAFTTGNQFVVQQSTGNPTGGTLMHVISNDADVPPFAAGDGTNGIQVSQAGALTATGTGSITATALSADARGQFSEVITGGAGPTLSIDVATGEGYGSIHYVDQADTVTLPAVQDGCSFTIVTIGAIAVTVDVNASDGIMLDGSGTFDADGDSITNSSTAGDMVTFTYYSATGWLATSDGNWTAN